MPTPTSWGSRGRRFESCVPTNAVLLDYWSILLGQELRGAVDYLGPLCVVDDSFDDNVSSAAAVIVVFKQDNRVGGDPAPYSISAIATR